MANALNYRKNSKEFKNGILPPLEDLLNYESLGELNNGKKIKLPIMLAVD